jgi:hypothetical protein
LSPGWNTALILADKFGTANLTSIGGPADQRVFDGIVQEINIRTGIIWELGGKQSTFKLRVAAGQVLDKEGKIFASP